MALPVFGNRRSWKLGESSVTLRFSKHFGATKKTGEGEKACFGKAFKGRKKLSRMHSL